MKVRGYISSFLLSMAGGAALAAVTALTSPEPVQAPPPEPQVRVPAPADSAKVRYSVRKTVPLMLEDLKPRPVDLRNPQNMTSEVEYDVDNDQYIIRSKAGDSELGVPLVLTPKEYTEWSLKRSISDYYREKNRGLMKTDSEEFDFTNLHFDLGPAEKIFGKGGVQIKTKGSAELSLGMKYTNVENPTLSERMRKTMAFDFDEKINLSVNGKVGDKMDLNMNYNTDATYDFDSKKIKLKYEGKEDEIIKLLEAGNVSMPSNSSLIKGASSLFGIRADLQFGKWKFQTVISQQETESKTVSSKGGVQTTPFEFTAVDYEENQHFFFADYFRDGFDNNMKQLPNVLSGITIKNIEVWVTNKSGNPESPRNIVAFTKLGETPAGVLPANRGTGFYDQLMLDTANLRNISLVNSTLTNMDPGMDYEKIENARLLRSTEYTVNTALGYISLRTRLNPDEILGVAFTYTYGARTYQVGELSTDIPDNSKCLFVKLLKSTTNSPAFPAWNLMMKNVYPLRARQIQKENFKLDITYENDSAGVALNYISEGKIAGKLLLRVMGLDRLDKNNKTNSDGVFDYVSGYTILPATGSVIFPVKEPFGSWLRDEINDPAITDKRYVFQELYDSTKTYAKQLAEKNKFKMSGEYRASASESQIDLGAGNIPRGSVVVKAGGVTLVENSDYTVDYTRGLVTILNQSIIDAGTSVSVSLESNSNFSMQRRTMLGMNAIYEASKNLTIGASVMHLSERPLQTKVAMGNEPINNTIWGVNVAWKKETQWLTNMVNKLPFVTATAPSTLNLTAEFAQLIPGHSSDLQGDASYIDDFESAELPIDLRTPSYWMLASTPATDTERFPEAKKSNNIEYGFNRSLLAWYYVDPLFTNKNSSLTPGHIKGDLNQLSNHAVREVYQTEVFPYKESSYTESATINVLNLAYYPSERGPYNLDPGLNSNGTLPNPEKRWGGIMRKMDNPDFESANVEYIEFWMLDPFIDKPGSTGGDFYINLGEVSEDVLKDGKKFAESGLPVSGDLSNVEYTAWGKIPKDRSLVYAFDTNSSSRRRQDVGLNGLSAEEERSYSTYSDYLTKIRDAGVVNMAPFEASPANDVYHYFRGSDYDNARTSILARYKRYNNTEGNSVTSEDSPENYDTSSKSSPDVEDINQDFTLNESEKYYEYKIHLEPDMKVGSNYVTDIRTTSVKLRNGNTAENVKWYQFKIPIRKSGTPVGTIQDFSSIRFMRMYLTNFTDSVVLRFAKLDLVRADWRVYDKQLKRKDGGVTTTDGNFELYAVNIEENSDKAPVNYVMPPGITRVVDPGQQQLRQQNEQALSLKASNLSSGDAKAIYKSMGLDMRQYNHIQMFAHAEALSSTAEAYTPLNHKEVAMFIRLGTDFNNNYYEYEVPLTVTPAGSYNGSTLAGCQAVWPEENMLDVDFTVFTELKKLRNSLKVSYTTPFYRSDNNKPNNTITIVGNPSLANVKTIMIGVRNLSSATRSAEVWVNELRLQDFDESGGWAAQGNLSVQLSDLGSVAVSGHVETAGFGGLEESVSQRRKDDYYQYSVTTNVDAGRFLPPVLKLQAPLYFSYSKEIVSPLYDPLNEDLLLDDVLDTYDTKAQRDSVLDVARTISTYKNFSLSNMKFNIASKKPMPWDPANLNFSYSFSKRHNSATTTKYEDETNWKLSLGYNYSPVYKPWVPFGKSKSKSSSMKFFKAISINWLPQNVGFNSDITRFYQETQLRDIENAGSEIPVSVSKNYLWNRDFTLRWDLTKNLRMSFTSATQAEIEEPAGVVNKALYPDEYSIWKDSVRHSLLSLGRPLDYKQSFTAGYTIPFDQIPILNWISKTTITYASSYTWDRGMDLADGTSLGNTIANQGKWTVGGTMELEKLYNKVPFLQKVNKKFASSSSSRAPATNTAAKKEEPKKFEKEIELRMDTATQVVHNMASKKPRVSAIRADGTRYPVKYKVQDANKILILTQDSVKVKLTVRPGVKPEDKDWYKYLEYGARFAMMARSFTVTYSKSNAMTLPGFMPEVGDFFGQKGMGGALAPGLDFALGLSGEGYIQKAVEKDWLLRNKDDYAVSASTSAVEEIQVKMILEPFRDFKIDLNASRARSDNKSIQFMYDGMPTTLSGNFSMTVVTISTAFESSNQNNGYSSKAFDRFRENLRVIQARVQSRYESSFYPAGAGDLAGQPYRPENGTVKMHSADVMIPAFLAAYTGKSADKVSLDLFPTLASMLPNWNITYAGFSKLAFMKKYFKSFDITHGYKSIYTVGSYNSFSSYMSYMDGLGFVTDVTDESKLIPSSPYDISTVSVNESFSPLVGVNMTFLNGITGKLEYRHTRTLTMSITALQIVENISKDFVIGTGYKIVDFQPFSPKMKGRNANRSSSSSSSGTRPSSSSSTVSHDLNLRLDFSIRNQSALNRNIMDGLTQATSGNKTLKWSFSADYILSRQLTLKIYYDYQRNTPLISSASYPVTNANFGGSLKFNLTR